MYSKQKKRILIILWVICLCISQIYMVPIERVSAADANPTDLSTLANTLNAIESDCAEIDGNIVRIVKDIVITRSTSTPATILVPANVTLEIPENVIVTINKSGTSTTKIVFQVNSAGTLHVLGGGKIIINHAVTGGTVTAISIASGGELKHEGSIEVNDSSTTAASGILVNANAKFNIEGGNIQLSGKKKGYGIRLNMNSSFSMNGGSLRIENLDESLSNLNTGSYGIYMDGANATFSNATIDINDGCASTSSKGINATWESIVELSNNTIMNIENGCGMEVDAYWSELHMLENSSITIQDQTKMGNSILISTLEMDQGSIIAQKGLVQLTSDLTMKTNSYIWMKTGTNLTFGSGFYFNEKMDATASIILEKDVSVANKTSSVLFSNYGNDIDANRTIVVGDWDAPASATTLSANTYTIRESKFACNFPQQITASTYDSVAPYYIGELISTTSGTYTANDGGEAIEHLYQWYRVSTSDTIPIEGATKSSYTPVNEDMNCQIYLETTPQGNKGLSGFPVKGENITILMKTKVYNVGGVKTLNYNGNTLDLSTLSGLFTIDPNAGEQTYTIESGGTGEGTIGTDNKTLTVTKAGRFIIGLTTKPIGSYLGSEVRATLIVDLGAAPIAPVGLSKEDVSIYGGTDGKIKGLLNQGWYEYKKTEDANYKKVQANSSGEITGLTAGNYLVRIPESNLYQASANSQTIAITQPDKAPNTIVVNGSVMAASGLNITLTLKAGTKVIATANGVESSTNLGKYTFSIYNVPDGIYSLVAEAGSETASEIIAVINQSLAKKIEIDLTNQQTKSKVEAKTQNTPLTAVDGMEQLFLDTSVYNVTKGLDKEVIESGGSAEITLVTKLAEEKPEDADQITTSNKILCYMDLSVVKTLLDQNGNIVDEIKLPELSNRITITMDMTSLLQGKTLKEVYRVHDQTGFDKITMDKSKEEYFEQKGNYIILHVKKFSTYAFSYSETQGNSGGGNADGGSSGGGNQGGSTSGGNDSGGSTGNGNSTNNESSTNISGILKDIIIEGCKLQFSKVNQVANLALDKTQISTILKKAKNKTITIDFSKITDVNEYTFSIQPEDLKSVNRLILIYPSKVTLVLDQNSIQLLGTSLGKSKFTITMTNNRFYFTATQDGKISEWNNKDIPFLLFLPYTNRQVVVKESKKQNLLSQWDMNGVVMLKISGNMEYDIKKSTIISTTPKLTYGIPILNTIK